MKKFFLASTAVLALTVAHGQTYPIFGNEIPVTINGLTFSVQDPFISPDGNTLIFNHDNNLPNVKLYYASKINDSTFNFIGEIAGANQTTPNATNLSSCLDSANNLFWTSLRNYNPPTSYENLMHAKYTSGSATNLTKVYGNIYVQIPYWVIMDAEISYDGNYLYYTNTYFGPNGNDCNAPCYSQLNIAQKVNDTTFSKLSNSNAILTNVNDTNYLVYVPQITKDGLELYFTRVLKNPPNPNTEICVSVRNTVSDTFSLPSVIYSNYGWLPEAPSLTTNKGILYYHKQSAYSSGFFKIYMRYRTGTTDISETTNNEFISVFPNPFSTQTTLQTNNLLHNATLTVDNCFGQTVAQIKNISGQTVTFPRDNLPSGLYFVRLTTPSLVLGEGGGEVFTGKLVITDK
ncbi:MAG: T9SS type A sorting domain-containing protein [Bacteroidetes bacterium]|nr:T9SS type A sorting domain-containing protein [Bacteroidota bacterium]